MLHIFVDNSNLFHGGAETCKRRNPEDPSKRGSFRVSIRGLIDFVADSRPVNRIVVGGSVPPEAEALWSHYRQAGAVVELQERGESSGKEIAVDEWLQLEMHKILTPEPPRDPVVLVTGDGNGYQQGKGFIAALRKLVEFGHAIEVASWEVCCNRKLREFAATHGRFRLLDEAYEKITFQEKPKRAA